MNDTVGVIGLGIMGAAMARNLLRAGYSVSVWNRSADKAALLGEAGIRICRTPAEVLKGSKSTFVMVRDPKALLAVCEMEEGIFSVPGEGRALIQSGTMDLATTRTVASECERRGYRFLDCPVTGSKKQVEAAQLVMLAGGPADLIEELRPVLSAVGHAVVNAGGIGSGTALKLCMNLVVAHMTTGVCESVTLARTLDIDPSLVFEALSQAPALACPYYAIKREPLIGREYPPAFSLENMLKDVNFMCQEARERGQALPVTEAVRALMASAESRGLGGDDLTVITQVLEAAKKVL